VYCLQPDPNTLPRGPIIVLQIANRKTTGLDSGEHFVAKEMKHAVESRPDA
jgi:hypothetical protein